MIFVRGLTPNTLALDVPLDDTVASLRCAVQAKSSVHPNYWLVVYAGRQLADDQTLRQHGVGPDSTLQFVGRLLGGKGGFGSLLRGAGRAILTDNVDACRDLSGRRLRQANAEKRLAEWAAQARERELEKIALKHVKEQQKATQKEERAQVDSEAVRREQQEALDRVSAAVVAAQDILNGGTLETGKRKAGLSDIQKPAKRARIYGFEDLSSSDSDDDSEYEAAARLSKAGHMAAAASSGDDSELSAQETALTIAKADPEAPSTSAAAAAAAASETPVPQTSAQEGKTSSASAATVLNTYVLEPRDQAGQHPHDSSSIEPAAAAAVSLPDCGQSSAVDMPCSVDSAAAENLAPIDLADFSSSQQLEAVGLDRLKAELQKHGLKCGGNLKERAARLFLLKSTPLNKLEQQHFSKPAKKK